MGTSSANTSTQAPEQVRERTSLADYSDQEIANEYHWRMLKALGDPAEFVELRFDGCAPDYWKLR
jgi:hypothetical protein